MGKGSEKGIGVTQSLGGEGVPIQYWIVLAEGGGEGG